MGYALVDLGLAIADSDRDGPWSVSGVNLPI
jgi:hypothetical protein